MFDYFCAHYEMQNLPKHILLDGVTKDAQFAWCTFIPSDIRRGRRSIRSRMLSAMIGVTIGINIGSMSRCRGLLPRTRM
jgi:hypothetical protein